MAEARGTLLYLALKYQGNWDSIYNAIITKEDIDDEALENTVNAFKGNFITIVDQEYPTKLRQTFKPPFVIFYQGDINLISNENIVSVSCGRNVSREDYRNAEQLLKNDYDLTYLVGSTKNDMDKYVASFSKPTIAVIGHSLMAVQPLNEYEKFDLVLTEIPPNVIDITKEGLMMRTRIISSLCDKELVISAKKYSGTTVIVNQALELGKDVLVVPKLNQNLLNFQLLEEGAIGCTRANQLI